MRILVAEDEPDMRSVLTKRLKAEGYGVDACEDGLEALSYLEAGSYDALVLDIMMPRMDGLNLLERLRQKGDATPVLILTAKDSVADRVRGLDAGSDDYLTKPFAFDELLARLRVLLRRRSEQATNELKIADLVLDTASRSVRRGAAEIRLSGKEFSILEYLISNQGTVLSRERILDHVWSYDYDGESNVVDVYMRYLRRKVDEPFARKLIHTVRGAGYVLREENQKH